MKKLLAYIIIPSMFIFIVWIIVYTTTYGSIYSLQNTHLDLKAMFNKFNFGSDINFVFRTTFKSFVDSMKKIISNGSIINMLSNNQLSDSNAWTIIWSGVETLLNPIKAIAIPLVVFGYLLALVCELLVIITCIASAIFDFIFNPVFIN